MYCGKSAVKSHPALIELADMFVLRTYIISDELRISLRCYVPKLGDNERSCNEPHTKSSCMRWIVVQELAEEVDR